MFIEVYCLYAAKGVLIFFLSEIIVETNFVVFVLL